MKKNVGTLDAIMRITVGLTGVAWGTAKMVKQPYRSLPVIVTVASAMQVAEGITRYCPMLDLLKMNSQRLNQAEINDELPSPQDYAQSETYDENYDEHYGPMYS